jgi:5-methyltetrahydropteroyltriglutamate--homocysteine methyltransferase
LTRIRSTHVGSLIRPPELLVYEAATQRGESIDQTAYESELRSQVAHVVQRQAQAGIDIVSDGEFGKANWISYLYDRVSGIEARAIPEGENRLPPSRDRLAFPGAYAQHDTEFMRSLREAEVPMPAPSVWVCTGPIEYDRTAVDRDIADFKAALDGLDVEGFLPVVAPASTYWLQNEHYGTEEEFVYALADALAVEYNAIVDSGLTLQVDDAVLMHEMDSILAGGGTIEDYRRWAQLRVDALNHALQGIPEEKVRYHICWGSWHGPHAFDPPLKDVVDLVLQVNAGYYAMEQANPRHEHEWRVWEDVRLPEGRKLIPGVVTHHTTIVEHPDLVADRLVRLAEVVGAENVLAGTDCGFAQTAFLQRVHPEVQWAKLEALAEGARRASSRLFTAV